MGIHSIAPVARRLGLAACALATATLLTSGCATKVSVSTGGQAAWDEFSDMGRQSLCAGDLSSVVVSAFVKLKFLQSTPTPDETAAYARDLTDAYEAFC